MNAWKAWLFSHEPRRSKLWENPTNPVSKSRGERRPGGQAGRWWLQHLEATLWFVNGWQSGCSLCNCAWLQLDDVQVVLDQSRDRLCPGGRRKQNLSSEVKGTDSKMPKPFLKSTSNECSVFLIVMNCQKLLAWEMNWLQYLLHYFHVIQYNDVKQ